MFKLIFKGKSEVNSLFYIHCRHNLQNLLYNDKSDKDISSIVAVISESSTVKNFADLKGKKACFPEYQGLGKVFQCSLVHIYLFNIS